MESQVTQNEKEIRQGGFYNDLKNLRKLIKARTDFANRKKRFSVFFSMEGTDYLSVVIASKTSQEGFRPRVGERGRYDS